MDGDFSVTHIEDPEDPSGAGDFLRVICKCGVTWDIDAPKHATLVQSWWAHMQAVKHRPL